METEHLGNADAYRVSPLFPSVGVMEANVKVTREIPLPYRRVERDSDEEEHKPPSTLARQITKTNARRGTISVHLDRIRRELVGENEAGRGPDAENVGARGHGRQREYEARRPGDSEERLGEV